MIFYLIFEAFNIGKEILLHDKCLDCVHRFYLKFHCDDKNISKMIAFPY